MIAVALAWADAPAALEGVGVDEHVGAALPALALTDEAGRRVALADLAGPRVVVFAQYRCPHLCGLVLRELATALRDEPDLHALTVSFDPTDTPAEAAAVRATTIGVLGHEADWPFVVGDAVTVATLLEVAGVHVRRDPDSGVYAHPAVALVVDADGRIDRYVPGPAFTPGLLAAPGGDHVFARCFRWIRGAHAADAALVLRAGGGAILAALVALAWRFRP